MLTKDIYMQYRRVSKDPIILCFKIYNSETKIKQVTYNSFVTFLKIWLTLNRRPNILQECQRFKNFFDKKFGVIK